LSEPTNRTAKAPSVGNDDEPAAAPSRKRATDALEFRRELEAVLALAPPGAVVTLISVLLPAAAPAATTSTPFAEDSMKRLLSPKEVAARLGVKAETVRTWKHQGRFPNARSLPNGAMRIPVTDVDALLASAQSASTESGSSGAFVIADPVRAAPNGPAFELEELDKWRSYLPEGHR
jgi:excisionase family DNA binding protein